MGLEEPRELQEPEGLKEPRRFGEPKERRRFGKSQGPRKHRGSGEPRGPSRQRAVPSLPRHVPRPQRGPGPHTHRHGGAELPDPGSPTAAAGTARRKGRAAASGGGDATEGEGKSAGELWGGRGSMWSSINGCSACFPAKDQQRYVAEGGRWESREDGPGLLKKARSAPSFGVLRFIGLGELWWTDIECGSFGGVSNEEQVEKKGAGL